MKNYKFDIAVLNQKFSIQFDAETHKEAIDKLENMVRIDRIEVYGDKIPDEPRQMLIEAVEKINKKHCDVYENTAFKVVENEIQN